HSRSGLLHRYLELPIRLEFSMQLFHRAMAISAIALSCSSFALTAVAESTLTLGEAVRATLQHNPQLAGYTFKLNALAGEKQTAALRPELRVNTDLENVAGSGELSGTKASELTISLSSAIELGGQRDARVNLVTARQQQLASSQRVLTLDVVTAVTQQFIRLLVAQEELTPQQESPQVLRPYASSLTRRVPAGGTADIEHLRANAGLTRGQLAMRQARQRGSAERIRLSAFWAATSSDIAAAIADLYGVPSTT